MLRLWFTVFLLAAYLASQLAAVPHAHAMEPAGHGFRLHVHVKANADHDRSDRGHVHEHHHHHHDHGPPHSHQPSDSPDHSLPVNHDDGCVYLPECGTAAIQAKVQLPDVDVANTLSGHISSLLFRPNSENTLASFAPPDVLRSGSDLCLMLRTLRI